MVCQSVDGGRPINARLEAVAEFVASPRLTAEVRTELKSIYDMQRLLARVTTGRATPRDLSFVARTLSGLPKLKAKLTGRSAERLVLLESRIDLCGDVRGRSKRRWRKIAPAHARRRIHSRRISRRAG